jgi:glycosyltransferase involved in cell wall biosynthesis
MKIAIVGPVHPYKGGIAQETTELAHRLTAEGHNVRVFSWKSQYPGRLYPGEQFVPDNKPELPVFENTVRTLSWKNPYSWWHAGRKLRLYDQVIFVWWIPTFHGPIYRTILLGMGSSTAKITVICHNVLPHEGRIGDKQFAESLLSRADRLIVHTDAQAQIATGLVNTPISVVPLPLALPGPVPKRPKHAPKLHNRLLFFGIVRPYKGLDVLLKAIAEIPNLKLLVAGEFWDEETYDQLISDLKIGSRVTLRKGYVPADDIPSLFAQSDALVLPYRGGTGSFHIKIAHTYGVPVIATTAGPLKDQLHDGVDGLQCEPDSVESLVTAIHKFYKKGVAGTLRKGIPNLSPDTEWATYVSAILK